MTCLFRALVSAVLFLPFSVMAQSTPVGGLITNNVTWSPAMGTVMVYSNVIVTNGARLTIEAGTTIRLTNNISISALANSRIDAEGTFSNRVLFLPMVGTNKWGNISASGANSFVTLRQAELAYGGTSFGSQSTGLIEDCYLHDVTSPISGNAARFVTMRRDHIKNYSSVEFNSGTIILAEDSLYENMAAPNSDALEIQAGPAGSIIRRCTFRHSHGSNSDALDFNGTTGVLIEDCLVYDFSDKGVSMGAAAAGGAVDHGIIVRNCLIYNVDTGIAVKDGSTCGIYNVTIAGCNFGMRLYQKFTTPIDGGHVTNSYNNILWGNTTTVSLTNNSSITATYSDFQGTNWPGTGNISSDPLFIGAAQHDYRLGSASPAIRSGYVGSDMGASYPVGAPMALSHPRFESITKGPGVVDLAFWADSERSYSAVSGDSLVAGNWLTITNVPAPVLPTLIQVSESTTESNRFYRLVTPATGN